MKLTPALLIVLSCLYARPVAVFALQNEIEVEREYLKADKKELVSQAMNPDPETAKVFWPLYNQYQEALRPIGDRRVKLIMDFAENYRDMSDQKAEQLLDDNLKIQGDMLDLQKQFVKKFRKALPAPFVSRYFQVENKIGSAINAGLAKSIPLVQLP